MVVNLLHANHGSRLVAVRSGWPSAGSPFDIVPVALNRGVADDEETQALRWEVNKRLGIVIGGFIAYYFFVLLVGPTDAAA